MKKYLDHLFRLVGAVLLALAVTVILSALFGQLDAKALMNL